MLDLDTTHLHGTFQQSSFCSCVSTVLNVPLLIRHQKSQKLHVNIDLRVTEAICEAKHLMNMDLEVPNEALLLVEMESEIKSTKLRLEANHQNLFVLFYKKKQFQVLNDVLRLYYY